MAQAKVSLNLSFLHRLVERLGDAGLASRLQNLSSDPGVAAIVEQAVADNFDKEGPGWKKLAENTIKRSISKKLRKNYLGNNQVAGSSEPARRILQKSGLLKKSVTTVGATGNIYRPGINKLTWGTDLSYASIHNNGGTVHFPGTSDGFGKARYVKVGGAKRGKWRKVGGRNIRAHGISIPQRKFLFLAPKWLLKLQAYVTGRARAMVVEHLRTGAGGGS